MKTSEILSLTGPFAKAKPDEILSSPAWTMPCRLGEEQCSLKLAEVGLADALALAVTLEDEPHTLFIGSSDAFPELAAIWAERENVPDEILLALVERDCGALLQLVENATRKVLRIKGVARDAGSGDAAQDTLDFVLQVQSGGRMAFSLTSSPAVVAALGQLRFIDTEHEAVRSITFSVETEIATFPLPTSDISSLSVGDALLLPEVESAAPRIIAEGKVAADAEGTAPFAPDNRLRVVAAAKHEITLGELVSGGVKADLANIQQLDLVRDRRVIAQGRFGKLGAHPAMFIESLTA